MYTEPLPTVVVSDGAQNVTGSDNVIRTSDIEEEVNTSFVHSMKLPSPHSTVKPLPTDVMSDGYSDTQLNWLYVSIATAIVLTVIAVVLILHTLQEKERRWAIRQSWFTQFAIVYLCNCGTISTT